jgi:sulfate adenylyltransferase subunit 1 (EFTu-like GTPase family)
MDLVNFDQAVYDKIVGDFQAFAKGLDNLPQRHADPDERAQWRQRRR